MVDRTESRVDVVRQGALSRVHMTIGMQFDEHSGGVGPAVQGFQQPGSRAAGLEAPEAAPDGRVTAATAFLSVPAVLPGIGRVDSTAWIKRISSK